MSQEDTGVYGPPAYSAEVLAKVTQKMQASIASIITFDPAAPGGDHSVAVVPYDHPDKILTINWAPSLLEPSKTPWAVSSWKPTKEEMKEALALVKNGPASMTLPVMLNQETLADLKKWDLGEMPQDLKSQLLTAEKLHDESTGLTSEQTQLVMDQFKDSKFDKMGPLVGTLSTTKNPYFELFTAAQIEAVKDLGPPKMQEDGFFAKVQNSWGSNWNDKLPEKPQQPVSSRLHEDQLVIVPRVGGGGKLAQVANIMHELGNPRTYVLVHPMGAPWDWWKLIADHAGQFTHIRVLDEAHYQVRWLDDLEKAVNTPFVKCDPPGTPPPELRGLSPEVIRFIEDPDYCIGDPLPPAEPKPVILVDVPRVGMLVWYAPFETYGQVVNVHVPYKTVELLFPTDQKTADAFASLYVQSPCLLPAGWYVNMAAPEVKVPEPYSYKTPWSDSFASGKYEPPTVETYKALLKQTAAQQFLASVAPLPAFAKVPPGSL